MKIAIMGMGGIGGFVGGMLAKSGIDTAYIARGAHLAAIVENGLTLRTDVGGGEFCTRPRIATNDPAEVGVVDVVIVSVKGYSLDEAVNAIAPMVGSETLVLPLLNGVGMGERIAQRLGKGKVLEGLIYVSSFISAPGAVTQVGALNKIIIGAAALRPVDSARIGELVTCIKAAGIDAQHSSDIEAAVWTKFAFICSFGGAMSYYRATAGELQTDKVKMETMRALCEEIAAVAAAKGIVLAQDVVQNSIKIAMGLSPDSKASLQRDLEVPGKPNELDQFCGEVVRLGEKLGVDTPVNRRIYDALRA